MVYILQYTRPTDIKNKSIVSPYLSPCAGVLHQHYRSFRKNKKAVVPSEQTYPAKDHIVMDFRTKKITASNPQLMSLAHFGPSPRLRQGEIFIKPISAQI
jgi:hypothetical protein